MISLKKGRQEITLSPQHGSSITKNFPANWNWLSLRRIKVLLF